MTAYLKKVEDFYNSIAPDYDNLKYKNRYYHEQLVRLYKFLVPQEQKVIEIGCATGELLAFLKPSRGVGIDISKAMIAEARKKYPVLKFINGYAENILIKEKFDYVILSDLVGILEDIQQAFLELHKIINEESRIIISFHNYLWEPVLLLAAKFGLKMAQPTQNWLSEKDIENFLELSNFEAIKTSSFLIVPIYIPFISKFLNKYIARLPIIRNLCLISYFIVRQKPDFALNKDLSVSIIIPARNEEGNIEEAARKIPILGSKTQLIFVEGNSRDNTRNEIIKAKGKYKGQKDILFVDQKKGVGKADAVRKGIEKATGDMLIVFDSDLTVDPKELPKFYDVLRTKKADFVQGSRLVYPLEKDSMRFLNIIGNKFFSAAFSFLLDQRIKDTLCGTKALYRRDYDKIAINRPYFGDFDPFGDFDLIFGASKLNLKILEIPTRYKARKYGETNISRFRHGLLLFKMTLFASRKIKFF